MLTIFGLSVLLNWDCSEWNKVRAYQKYYFKDIQYRLSTSQIKQQNHFDIKLKYQQQQASDFKFVIWFIRSDRMKQNLLQWKLKTKTLPHLSPQAECLSLWPNVWLLTPSYLNVGPCISQNVEHQHPDSANICMIVKRKIKMVLYTSVVAKHDTSLWNAVACLKCGSWLHMSVPRGL